jgi:Tfp pilus assembly protein PilO
MRPREQALVVVLLAVLVLVGFYYAVYRPRTEEARRLEAQLQQLTAERQRLEALVASRPQVEQRLQEAQARIAELETKLPSRREIPVLLVQLEDAVRQSRAKITLVRPGPLQAPTPQATPAPGGRGQQPAQPEQPQYQSFTVELGAEGDYVALVDFLQRLENFPRLMVLSDFRLTPITQEGRPPGSFLGLTVRATTYVLPETGEAAR